ncbi:MAG: S8 family peptidase [Bacillota bacterium]
MMYRNRRNFASNIHPKVLTKTAGAKEYLSVIIDGNGSRDQLLKYIEEIGGTVKYDLPLINAIAAEVPAKAVKEISRHHTVHFINHDAKVFKTMDIASLAVDSDLVNEAGYGGKGIGVAVIDTGVHPHDDLTKPTNRIVAFKDFVNERTKPYDDDGHGTHVAGIIAGSGYVNERYKGIAPEASIIGIKALDETGSGSTSDIVAGIQWAVDNKEKYNIKVISMSLGSAVDEQDRNDPLARAVDGAVRSGLTVVVSAGNSGPSSRTITSPGTSPSAITVGAADDNRTSTVEDDSIADFSSRGPTFEGLSKPDVVAPGVDIMSLSNKSNTAYVSYSGTSMAAPIVAGAAALLYEKEPNLTPSQVKSRIINSAYAIDRNRNAQGAGIISIRKMLDIGELSTPTVPAVEKPQEKKKPLTEFNPALLFLLWLFRS